MDYEIIKAKVIDKLSLIFDPELPVNIYDLGLIYGISFEVKDNYLHCKVDMTLTSPSCPVSDTLMQEVYQFTKVIEEIDEVEINLVFDPPWDNDKISKQGKEVLELHGFVFP